MEQKKGRALKVFLAIACGVGLGIVLGRELSEWWSPATWLWPIAAGVFAWLAVDFKAALAAIPKAWRSVKPSKETLAFFGWYMLVFLLVVFWCFLPLAIVISPSGGLVASVSYLAAMLGSIIASSCCWGAESKKLSDRNRRLKRTAWIMFPPVTIFYYLPRGLWWLVTDAVPGVARFCGRFFLAWWRLTHSDLRVLCLVYAVFFTAVGLLTSGPVVLWMIGGGAVGVFDDKVVTPWLQRRKLLLPAKE